MARSTLFLLFILATNATLALLHPFSHLPCSHLRLYLVLLSYVLGTGVILYLLFHPRNQWLATNRSCVVRNCVALTFDDGPDPIDTPRLLDILREKNVKATFFVIGQRAEQYPEIVRRAFQEGHLIANHTWSHPPLFCFLTPRMLRTELERGAQTIHRICGFRPEYFRSPVGMRHPLLGPSLKQMNQEFISWRVRSFDTVISNSARLRRRILKKVSGGDIILFHDRLPSGTHAMLQALPGIIDELRSRGLQFELVSTWQEVPDTSLHPLSTNPTHP